MFRQIIIIIIIINKCIYEYSFTICPAVQPTLHGQLRFLKFCVSVFFAFQQSRFFEFRALATGSNNLEYFSMRITLIIKILLYASEYNLKATFLVVVFPSFDNFSKACNIFPKFSSKIEIFLYFWDHCVSQKAEMIGIHFLRKTDSREFIIYFTVEIVLRISETI